MNGLKLSPAMNRLNRIKSSTETTSLLSDTPVEWMVLV